MRDAAAPPPVFPRKDRDSWAVVQRLGTLLRPGEVFIAPCRFSLLHEGAVPAAIHARHWRDVPRLIVFDGALAREYPPVVREMMARSHQPVFSAGRYAIFRRGPPLPWTMLLRRRIAPLLATLDAAPHPAPRATRRAALVTTFARPRHLARSLASLARTGVPILVVGDGSPTADEDARIAAAHGATHLALPHNRGIAAALNTGLAYWLADPEVAWISTFNDDVEVAPDLFDRLTVHEAGVPRPLLSGYHNHWHRRDPAIAASRPDGTIRVRSVAGVHLHAHRDDWAAVMPIPTVALGAPSPGLSAEEDWWVGSWSPGAAAKTGRPILVLPGLVDTFSPGGADSTWGNAHDGRAPSVAARPPRAPAETPAEAPPPQG